MTRLQCPLCYNDSFTSIDALRENLISIMHISLTCELCKETVGGIKELIDHLEKHIHSRTNVYGVTSFARDIPKLHCKTEYSSGSTLMLNDHEAQDSKTVMHLQYYESYKNSGDRLYVSNVNTCNKRLIIRNEALDDELCNNQVFRNSIEEKPSSFDLKIRYSKIKDTSSSSTNFVTNMDVSNISPVFPVSEDKTKKTLTSISMFKPCQDSFESVKHTETVIASDKGTGDQLVFQEINDTSGQSTEVTALLNNYSNNDRDDYYENNHSNINSSSLTDASQQDKNSTDYYNCSKVITVPNQDLNYNATPSLSSINTSSNSKSMDDDNDQVDDKSIADNLLENEFQTKLYMSNSSCNKNNLKSGTYIHKKFQRDQERTLNVDYSEDKIIVIPKEQSIQLDNLNRDYGMGGLKPTRRSILQYDDDDVDNNIIETKPFAIKECSEKIFDLNIDSCDTLNEERSESPIIDEPVVAERKIKNFECEVCHKLFSARRYLQNHRHIHESDHIKCDICNDYVCKTKSGLRTHKFEVHSQKPQQKFKCSYCSETFKKNYGLKRHVERKHTAATKVCEFDDCNKEFKCTENYIAHLKLHTNLYKCKSCYKNFNRIWSLRRHEARHEPSKYKCNYCDKFFTRRDSLLGHNKSRHNTVDLN